MEPRLVLTTDYPLKKVEDIAFHNLKKKAERDRNRMIKQYPQLLIVLRIFNNMLNLFNNAVCKIDISIKT